jgi:hypothetical protein
MCQVYVGCMVFIPTSFLFISGTFHIGTKNFMEVLIGQCEFLTQMKFEK